MRVRLKRLADQVIVITGASSGIGLATARLAGRKGAKLVLAARSDDALRQLVQELRGQGVEAVHVDADVGEEADVRRIAHEAQRVFGGFDTWVNNAGVSVYGRSLEVTLDDMRRVFDTNFWGVVHGSRVACETLRRRGGALINVGSIVSDIAAPLQGIYSASKHAVKGWTDALRLELEDEGAPVSVTLIKPGPIDTPYTQHAKNYLQDQPTHVAPVYAPESVAQAILHAATRPVRDLYVGGSARMMASVGTMAPRATDKVSGPMFMRGTHSGRPRDHKEALHQASEDLRERGDYRGLVRRSNYTRMATHPALTGALFVGAGLLMATMRADGWSRGRGPGPRTDAAWTEQHMEA
jgi:short-subunit dehydrogenase